MRDNYRSRAGFPPSLGSWVRPPRPCPAFVGTSAVLPRSAVPLEGRAIPQHASAASYVDMGASWGSLPRSFVPPAGATAVKKWPAWPSLALNGPGAFALVTIATLGALTPFVEACFSLPRRSITAGG